MNIILSNPIFDAYHASDLLGKGIFIMLFSLSIITWVIFLKKFFLYRSAQTLGNQMREAFQKKRANPLSLEFAENFHPYAELYRTLKSHTLELLNKNRSAFKESREVYLSHSDIDLIEAYMTSTISTQMEGMKKNLFILSTVVSLAPFLGLLGTVWGILLTFGELQSGVTVSANATVMGGLAMALGTTVLGLVVAIPALIAYNYLKSRAASFTSEISDFSQLLLASIELQYRQIDLK